MDLKLQWGPAGSDLVLENGDLAADRGLVTAVLLSLYSDGTAPLERGLPLLEQDRRGYWAEEPGDPYGSLLWLLLRAKATAESAALGRDYAQAGLSWLEREGIARTVEVAAVYRAGGVLALDVKLTRGTARRWASLWDAVLELRLSLSGSLLQVTLT